MRMRWLFSSLVLCVFWLPARGQQIDAPTPQRATIYGTVTDAEDAAIPAATVTLDGSVPSAHRTLTTDGAGSFEITNLDPSLTYKLTVSANGFAAWTSAPIALKPGQALDLDDVKLTISVVETTVAALTVEQLARQQATAEEKQRVFGVIPNFYVVYDKN